MAVLQYSFDIIGQNKVASALASNERLFAQHSSKINRIVGASARGGSRSDANAADRSAAQGARQRQREIDAISRSQSALSRQRSREENATAKAARDASRERQRAIDGQVRSQAALGRQREREERASVASSRAMARERYRYLAGTVGRGTGRVVNALTAVGTAGAAMIGVGGAALAASSVQQAISLDDTARRLAIQGRAPGEAGADPNELRKAFVQTGIQSGIAPEQVAAGASKYVAETGDLKGAMANLGTFATVAQATGASIEEIATAAAHMRKLGITSVEDMQQALATLAFQGKKGAFELKNMATEFPEVLSQAANFGVRGVSGLTEVGGLLQVAKSATGSGAEASTATQAMFRQLSAKSEDIQTGAAFSGRKVNVFKGGDTKGEMRDFRDVLGDILVASRGDMPQLQNVFDIRGIKAINPLINVFRETRIAALKGGATESQADEKARVAALAVLDDAANVGGTFTEIQRDAADASKALAVQLQILKTQLQGALASELLPAINRLVPELLRMTPEIERAIHGLASMATWLADNPLKGLGAALAASIGAEIVKAQLGALFQQAIQASLGGGGTGGPQLNLASAKITVAGSIAIAAIAAASDQADKLDQQLGTKGKKGSVYAPFFGFDEKGNFSLERLAGDTYNSVANPYKVVTEKGGAAVDFIRALLGGYDEQFSIEAKERDRKERQAQADAAIKANAELEAQLSKLSEAAATASASLLKIEPTGSGERINRGNAPSPVKP